MTTLVRRTERGMTTAEYAVGMLAAVCLAGVLITVVRDPRIFEMFVKFVLGIFKIVDSFLGQK